MLDLGIYSLLIAVVAFVAGVLLIVVSIWVERAGKVGLYLIAASGALLLLSFAFCSTEW